jgi:hypothetical protein
MSGFTIAATIASTAMSFVAQRQQAQAQAQQANFQAAVARNNAIIARQNADAIEKSGKVAEQERRELIQRHIGTAKAVQAANGFLVDDDEDSTNVQERAAVAEAGALDILRIRDRVDDEQRRALIQGDQFTAQAGLFDLKGADAGSSAAGFGTLLAGAADVAILAKG